MKKYNFDCKLFRQIGNISKMIKYGYLDDKHIIGENIQYDKNKKNYYKVFKSNKKSKLTIFFVHGGGWWQGSPSLYSGVGKFFAKKGFTTVIVGYRLVPKFTYPAQIEDCFKALNHYINNNYNNEQLVIGGYSAGSELASHLVFDLKRQDVYKINPSILKGFFSIAGVLDFTKCSSRSSKKLIKNYLNGKDQLYCNPIGMISSKYSNIPVLCIHGDKDSLINVENSISFSTRLNNNATLKIIKDIDHEHAIDTVRGPGNSYSNFVIDFLNKIAVSKEVN